MWFCTKATHFVVWSTTSKDLLWDQAACCLLKLSPTLKCGIHSSLYLHTIGWGLDINVSPSIVQWQNKSGGIMEVRERSGAQDVRFTDTTVWRAASAIHSLCDADNGGTVRPQTYKCPSHLSAYPHSTNIVPHKHTRNWGQPPTDTLSHTTELTKCVEVPEWVMPYVTLSPLLNVISIIFWEFSRVFVLQYYF